MGITVAGVRLDKSDVLTFNRTLPKREPETFPCPIPAIPTPHSAFTTTASTLSAGWWRWIGTRIQSIAIGWEIYQRTGEALSLGLVGLAQALPMMLLALPAGMLADRYERRRLAMFSLLGMTATSLALAAFSATQGPIPWMYALLALDATAMALGRPARVALLPQLVPAETFPNAVTWNTSLMHLASVGGPALGGFVIAVNLPVAYLIAAASSLWLAFILSPDPVPAGRESAGAGQLAYLSGRAAVRLG